MYKMNLVDYDNIKFIEVYGLRRSGNHAILTWLINNLNTEESNNYEPAYLIAPTPELGFISQYLGDVIHINDVGSNWALNNGKYLNGLIDAYVSIGMKTVILSYEDRPYNASFLNVGYSFLKNSTKIVITRDIKSIFASRVMGGHSFFNINKTILETWLKNENSDCTKIRYEDWLTSRSYRDDTSTNLGLQNIDITHIVSTAGGGSSFKDQTTGLIDKDKLLNRYKSFEFTKEVQDLLNSPEVIQKRKEIGYI